MVRILTEIYSREILEKIKERNDSFGKYFKEKSLSNLTILRNSRSNLKKKKEEAKTMWIASRVAELENRDVDPRTSWIAVKKIAEGLYGHHKNTASMKIKKAKRRLLFQRSQKRWSIQELLFKTL